MLLDKQGLHRQPTPSLAVAALQQQRHNDHSQDTARKKQHYSLQLLHNLIPDALINAHPYSSNQSFNQEALDPDDEWSEGYDDNMDENEEEYGKMDTITELIQVECKAASEEMVTKLNATI